MISSTCVIGSCFGKVTFKRKMSNIGGIFSQLKDVALQDSLVLVSVQQDPGIRDLYPSQENKTPTESHAWSFRGNLAKSIYN